MTKTKKLLTAELVAITDGSSVGFCVFDGHYYTGTFEQLSAIGCVQPSTQCGDRGDLDELESKVI